MSEQNSNMLDYAYVLIKWRRMIIWSVVVVTVITASISLILPKQWTARGVMMPPEEDLDQLNLSALQAARMPANLASMVGASTPADNLKTYLELNRTLGAIVDRFDLIAEYEAPHRERAIELLGENTNIELEREGSVIIEIAGSSPQQAADMVNTIMAEVDGFNRQLKSKQATKLREFLERRLQVRRDELRKARTVLLEFERANGLVNLATQTQAIVDVAKSLVGRLSMVEVELDVLDHWVQPDNEQRLELELRRQALREQLQQLAVGAGKEAPMLGPSLQTVPQLGFRYAELTLDLQIRQEVALFLGSKLEEARYREHLNTPTLHILDQAVPPETRSAPRRTLMTVIALALSLVLSTILAFTFESWIRLGEENADRLDAIRRVWRS